MAETNKSTGFLSGIASLASSFNPIAGGLGSIGGVLSGTEVDAPPGDMSSRSYGTFTSSPKIVQGDKATSFALIGVVVILAFVLIGGFKRG